MAKDDWFRNSDWNPAIEARFFEKLRRARQKGQYLRIQASYLSDTRPDVTLQLLKEYFALGDDFDQAQALVDEADAYLSLGKLEAAIESLQRALQRERILPCLFTQAWSDYAMLVATQRIESLFADALTVLAAHKDRLTFPADHFFWHASRALIQEAMGKTEDAREDAASALAAARKQHSGFRYHPKVGLVASDHQGLMDELSRLASK
jgi:tetratricopeptide (TPR) repeat protein